MIYKGSAKRHSTSFTFSKYFLSRDLNNIMSDLVRSSDSLSLPFVSDKTKYSDQLKLVQKDVQQNTKITSSGKLCFCRQDLYDNLKPSCHKWGYSLKFFSKPIYLNKHVQCNATKNPKHGKNIAPIKLLHKRDKY